MINVAKQETGPGNGTSASIERESVTRHKLPLSIRVLFDDSSVDPVSYPRKASAILALLVFVSNAMMIGAWAYFRLSDLWMVWTERLVPLDLVQLLQVIVSIGAGAVVFAALFLIVLLVNAIAFGVNRIWPREVDAGKVTVLQFGFSPLFSAIIIVAHVITQTHYYDQGLAFVPFSLTVVYFAWLALMGVKIRRGMAATIGERGAIAGKDIVIWAVVIGILWLLFIVSLPVIVGDPPDWIYRIIF
jgi:hypothetical protein